MPTDPKKKMTDSTDSQDTSAADEPTAMWGADALRELGLEEASKAHDEADTRAIPPRPHRPTPPARPAAKLKARKASAKKRPSSVLASWGWLVLLALVVGVAVYFLVGYFLA